MTDLAKRVLTGDRAALAQAITLIESTRADHRNRAQALLQELLPHSGNSGPERSIRLGITGVPGVGKSTLIDQLGINLIHAGHKVAVLAVDPTSSRSGGSILGDKTRMGRLALETNGFIRPSPSGATLGGVARRTREAMLICEAAGFDVVIVETVGIGQSEVTVAGMVDFFLVLALPGAGDELQGIKKGVLEIADMIAVNKCDGDMELAAQQAAAQYSAALHILAPASPAWQPPVAQVSGLANKGLDAMWSEVLRHRQIMQDNGAFEGKRQDQMALWLRSLVEEQVLAHFFASSEVSQELKRLETEVRAGKTVPGLAAKEILNLYRSQ